MRFLYYLHLRLFKYNYYVEEYFNPGGWRVISKGSLHFLPNLIKYRWYRLLGRSVRLDRCRR